MSSAQEEFNQLVNSNRDISSSHPEDRTSSPVFSDEESTRNADSSDEDEQSPDMASTNYHIPRHTFEANTGPKGVIADAQAFERARKKSLRRTLLSAAGLDNGAIYGNKVSRDNSPSRHRANSSPSSSDDDEESFLRKWRASRMQELQSRSNRHTSPRGRVYGRVDNVDAAAYLDAIEKVASDAVVVVCIYDPENDESAIVEECLNTIARRKQHTRFVKLHSEIAEMDHIRAPALLAYRGGEVFATITDVIRNIPRGRPCSADSLEDLLKMHRVL
ncbi:hypothetical protein N7468_001174 [Penicillium chermesinum]|uniref:Phosducin domain-containing protein n=1 Tax=Penicillium chermesinum TaxID=63820 RepID=A0A9W9PHU4_9EURO|nr:uncharacterized protein N7468_001174 [Penicillium chermesinum]KAJ5246191.1 hypothetical protein N7468_001174 [Penicillium chermesinum]